VEEVFPLSSWIYHPASKVKLVDVREDRLALYLGVLVVFVVGGEGGAGVSFGWWGRSFVCRDWGGGGGVIPGGGWWGSGGGGGGGRGRVGGGGGGEFVVVVGGGGCCGWGGWGGGGFFFGLLG